ncbi:MAG: carboxypeptidase-like regulatory domain-containing protein, partial [Bacteroidales bacterium]|nr:carboxypeptidase-like regulatory domain-containing protein [Bacteroidales bacterium]
MKQLFLRFAVILTSLVGIFSSHAVMAQSRTVSGTVIDETGTPMIGLTVIVTGTTNGVTTDIDGNYQINVSGNETLT